jgi:hypothetical protein
VVAHTRLQQHAAGGHDHHGDPQRDHGGDHRWRPLRDHPQRDPQHGTTPAGRPSRSAISSTPAAGQPGRQQDVLPHAQRGDQVEGLEDEPDPGATQPGQCGLGQSGQVGAGQPDRPRGRLVQAGGALQQRALARSGAAHDRGERAGGDVEVDAVEGVHGGGAAPVRAVDAAQRDGGFEFGTGGHGFRR